MNALFEQHSYYHENKKNKKAPVKNKRKLRHTKSVMLKRSTSQLPDGGNEMNRLNVSIIEKTDEEDQASDGSKLLSE